MAMIKCKECGAEMSNKAKQCPNCGKRRKGIGTLIGIIAATLLIIAVASICFSGGSSNSSDTIQQNSSSVTQNEQTSNTDNIKIKNSKFGTSLSGDKIVYITYEWTNNDNEKRSFGYAYSAKAYQDGVELSEDFFGDNEAGEDFNDVKPGVTQTFTEAYELKNSKDDIDIEVTGLFFNDEEIIVSKTFKIK